jgi:hypothetical protein
MDSDACRTCVTGLHCIVLITLSTVTLGKQHVMFTRTEAAVLCIQCKGFDTAVWSHADQEHISQLAFRQQRRLLLMQTPLLFAQYSYWQKACEQEVAH